jgi:hypothetical protein
MPQLEQGYSLGSFAPSGELVTRVTALRPGGALTVIGIDQAQFSEVLSGTASAPRMLRLDLSGVATTPLAIDRILTDLADLAAAMWPNWVIPEFPEVPHLQARWHRAAMRFASKGNRPRFPRLVREIEFANLLSVLPDLVLLADVDPMRSERAAPIIAALEWCRRQGVAVVVLFGEEPAPEAPWDLLLYSAVIVGPWPVEPATRRLILPPSCDGTSQGSAIERRMREALKAAPDLAGLFEDEVTLQLGALGPTPRVDLL